MVFREIRGEWTSIFARSYRVYRLQNVKMLCFIYLNLSPFSRNKRSKSRLNIGFWVWGEVLVSGCEEVKFNKIEKKRHLGTLGKTVLLINRSNNTDKTYILLKPNVRWTNRPAVFLWFLLLLSHSVADILQNFLKIE